MRDSNNGILKKVITFGVAMLGIMFSANSSAQIFTATLDNVNFSGGRTATGSFVYDAALQTILKSDVTFNGPAMTLNGPPETYALSEINGAAINMHDNANGFPPFFVEIVLLDQPPFCPCSLGSACGADYVSLNLASLPTAPGDYPLLCAFGSPPTGDNTSSSSANYVGGGAALTSGSLSVVEETVTLTLTASAGGIATATSTSGIPGSFTTLTAVSSNGYVFSSWTVTSAGGGSISSTNHNPATFTFGSANAAVTANFVALPSVTLTVNAGTGGSASADLTTGHQGSVATLTAIPASGYSFLFWDVDQAGGGLLSSGVIQNMATFTFGTANAVVTAIFSPLGISGQNSQYAKGEKQKEDGLGDTVNEPVDTGTGAHTISHSIFRIRGGQDLEFVIDYDSICRFNDVVGQGWSHNFEASVQPATNGAFRLNWNAKSFNIFTPQAGNSNVLKCADLPVIYDSLWRNPDGSFTLREPSQRHFDFDSSGRLLQIVNLHGQAIQLIYPPASSSPTQIVEAVSGKAFNLTYNSSNLLAHITDGLLRTASFAYDSSNRLTSINTSKGAASQTYSFNYDAQGRILSETNPEDVVVFTDTYDSQGRVATQSDAIPGHDSTRFYYDESQTNLLITTVVDRTGATNVYIHNALYQFWLFWQASG